MLAVIVPYYNYLRDETRIKNTLNFLEYLRGFKDVFSIVIESVLPDHDYLFRNVEVANKYCGAYVPTSCKSIIWRKENLINLAMPLVVCDAFAWIDSDLTFISPTWPRLTLDELKKVEVAQMFELAHWLDKDGSLDHSQNGFINSNLINPDDEYPSGNVLPGHPGHAWAMRTAAWKFIEGLPDKGIVGAGDTELAYSLVGEVARLQEEKSIEHYKDLSRQSMLISKLTYSFVSTAVVHHWHESGFIDKHFKKHWVLVDAYYDPKEDVVYNKDGLLELTDKGMRLQEPLLQLFHGTWQRSKQI
jgi:hypothetical protein